MSHPRYTVNPTEAIFKFNNGYLKVVTKPPFQVWTVWEEEKLIYTYKTTSPPAPSVWAAQKIAEQAITPR